MPIQISEIYNDEDAYINKSETGPIFDRTNPLIAAPACHKIPDIAILDQKKDLIDLNVVREHFKNEGRLSERQVFKIFRDSNTILLKEDNLIQINRKCYIIGDTHGQFYDLLTILDQFDLTTDTILFLGDYVDRGQFGCEVYLYLLLLKTHYPKNVYLLRGNHESERMTTYFTFKAECIHKYSTNIYECFIDSFNNLPLAACVQQSAFCCHGGISPNLKNILDVNKIDRFREVDYDGLFCDLLWADPNPKFQSKTSFAENTQRRCSFFYSYNDTVNFLKENNLKVIIRAHEVQEGGFQLLKEHNDHPTVCTVFSAPNYCDAYKNYGGFVEFDNEILKIHTFNSVQHPYCLPGNVDGINWSYPFVSESLLEFTLALIENLDSIEILESERIPAELNAQKADLNEIDSNSTKDGLKEIDFESEIPTNASEKVGAAHNAMNIKNESFIKNMVLLRTERECIDEFEEEDSALNCCALQNKESESMDFDEAVEKDKENEIVKNKEPVCSVTTKLSPSLIPTKIQIPEKPVGEILDKISIVQSEGFEEVVIDDLHCSDSLDVELKSKLEELTLENEEVGNLCDEEANKCVEAENKCKEFLGGGVTEEKSINSNDNQGLNNEVEKQKEEKDNIICINTIGTSSMATLVESNQTESTIRRRRAFRWFC